MDIDKSILNNENLKKLEELDNKLEKFKKPY